MHKTAAKRTNIVRRALRAALTSKMTAPLYRGRGLLLLAVIFVLGSTPVFVFSKNNAQAATSSHLNFQSRLQNIAGNTVADGLYNVEFKLYDHPTAGNNLWTETRSGANQVRVVGGYLSVNLGSVTAFPALDWDQDMYLTMNVNSDGEMTTGGVRMKLTAVPFAFQAQRAAQLSSGGITLNIDDILQKAPSGLQIVNSAVAGLRLNQTGSGALIQLQGDGVDVFTVSKTGSVYTFGSLNVDGTIIDIGTATQAGGLVLQNGAAKTGTLQVGTLAANRTYTLPDADGTICLTTTCTGGGGPSNAFVQDGNTFGATGTLGTNDVFGLSLETSGLQRLLIDAGGNVGIGTSGSPSQLLSVGGTTGNLTISSSGSLVAADLTSNGALTVVSGGASISGGLNNNNSGITNAGDITGVGTNLTASAALNIASGGTSGLTFTSASGLITVMAGTIQTADNLALDLAKATNTGLTLQNSGTGIANLNLLDGGLLTGGTQRVSNTGALENITGLTVINGGANITGNITLGSSSSDRLTIIGQLGGASPLVFQGATDDIFATTLGVIDPTANNTINLPNASGTLVLDTRSVLTPAGSGLSGGGDLSVDRSLSLDINGLTTKTNVNPLDYISVYDDTTSSVKKISRDDFLQGVLGALIYRGTWNAAANSPTLADNTGTNGHTYVVSVAGSENFGTGPAITFAVGDFVIHNGTDWEKAASSSDVVSVFGRTGPVVAQANDYTGLQISNTPSGTIAATNVQGAINELASEKIGSLNGLSAISQTFVNDTNVTVTSSGSTHTFGWSGQLSVARGGTGTNTFTPNGVLYGNGTSALQVSAAGTGGQVLIANASGVPTFTSLSGDVTVSATGVMSIGANTIDLTTDTVGNYIANLGALTGLTTTGNTGEGSTPTLSVAYGALTNTAVQGNTGITVTAGTNLSGGGAITLGAGGTVTLNTIANPTFGTSVTTPILTSAAGLSISSGATDDITLDSASNKIIIGGTDTTLERTGVGSYTIDLKDNATTSLALGNSSAGGSSFANLNLLDGSLQIAGTTVIGSDRTLQNLAGITNVGTFTSSAGLISLNASSNFATNINTGTSTGTITLGGGTAPLVISSTAFDVSATGALSGITTINTSGLITSVGLTAGTGLIQGTGGLTITGAAISLNASSNFATNINTGTSTGTITLGGGTAPLVISSTAFDVSAAGALSGIIGITFSSGNTIASSANANLTLDASGTGSLVLSGYNCSTQSNGGALTTNASGVVACSADDSGISDARLKENVADLDNNILNRIKNVRTVNFDFDCDKQYFKEQILDCRTDRQTGIIAQELEQIFPELVSDGEDGYKRVDFKALNFYNLKAVSELANILNSNGDAALNNMSTGGMLRLSSSGNLQNITGLNIISGGANISGGINNNGGGIANTGAVLGATMISGQSLTLNANASDNLLTLTKDGSGVFTIFNDGSLGMQLNSTAALNIKDGAGLSIFNIDSASGKISIGSGNNSKTVLLTLDNRSLADDPPGTNGATYYNTIMQRFRCYESNKWQDCLPAGDLTEPIAMDKVSWSLPTSDQEFSGAPRVSSSLTRAHEFRLRMRVTAAGATGATCRLQYASTDSGPWADLSANSSGLLSVSQEGTLKTEWLKLNEDARKEDTIIRVMCKGGDKPQNIVFYGVSLQLR